MGHSEHCDDRYCKGCDDSDYDPNNFPVECPECDHEGVLSDFEEITHHNAAVCKLRCPECEEIFTLHSAEACPREDFHADG